MKKNVIYGAGKNGISLYKFLNKFDCKVECFLQTVVEEDRTLEGLPVLTLDTISEDLQELNYFISVENPKMIADIKKTLAEKNIDESQIYIWNHFLEDNMFYEKHANANKYCILCDHKIEKFQPGGWKNQFFIQKSVIGGGYRDNNLCPCCGSLDRNRWVYWVLKNKTDIFQKESNVLHFAPEKMIRKKMKLQENCNYYCGDLEMKDGINRIDVTEIPFKDHYFDFVIINHVLEHVPDEKKAIEEMKRVLKKDGKLVISFPIALAENFYEDCSNLSREERIQKFGQDDHVRLYGKDYEQHLSKYGFHVDIFSPEKICNLEDIQKYGFLKNDILMICTKIE